MADGGTERGEWRWAGARGDRGDRDTARSVFDRCHLV